MDKIKETKKSEGEEQNSSQDLSPLKPRFSPRLVWPPPPCNRMNENDANDLHFLSQPSI